MEKMWLTTENRNANSTALENDSEWPCGYSEVRKGLPVSNPAWSFMETDLDLHCLQLFSCCSLYTFSLSEVKKPRWIYLMTIAKSTVVTLRAHG